MKKVVIATALTLSAISANAAGTLSTFLTAEKVLSRPSTATGTTDLLMTGAMEYVFPRSLSFYGGVSFILRDSFETTVNVGARLYSVTPVFKIGATPMWSFIGAGAYFVDNNAYYPEVGLRFATSTNTRMDIYLKVLNSVDTAYDRNASIGVGFTF